MEQYPDYTALITHFKAQGAEVSQQKEQLWVIYPLNRSRLEYDGGDSKALSLVIMEHSVTIKLRYKSWYDLASRVIPLTQLDLLTVSLWELTHDTWKYAKRSCYNLPSFIYYESQMKEWTHTYQNSYSFEAWYAAKIPFLLYNYVPTHNSALRLCLGFDVEGEIYLLDFEADLAVKNHCYVFPSVADTGFTSAEQLLDRLCAENSAIISPTMTAHARYQKLRLLSGS